MVKRKTVLDIIDIILIVLFLGSLACLLLFYIDFMIDNIYEPIEEKTIDMTNENLIASIFVFVSVLLFIIIIGSFMVAFSIHFLGIIFTNISDFLWRKYGGEENE